LDDPVYTHDKYVLLDVFGKLQKIAKDALWLEDDVEHDINAMILQKVFHLFKRWISRRRAEN
jgi:hypothetical protein